MAAADGASYGGGHKGFGSDDGGHRGYGSGSSSSAKDAWAKAKAALEKEKERVREARRRRPLIFLACCGALAAVALPILYKGGKEVVEIVDRQLHPRVVPPPPPPPLEGVHPVYPIENIVLQGGGAKGMIYAGAALAFEELGVLPYVKRYAAASAGCFPALVLSLGLTAEQLVEETNALDLQSWFDGGKNVPFGKSLVLGINAFRRMGLHPADMALEYMGDLLERYTGNKDLTFLEHYQRTGREYTVAVSNVSRMQSEICHVVTTPNMPIRRAIRASMSLPFMWEPIELFEGEKYVDGGLFMNFPLKAFDGWFLSTKREEGLFAAVGKANPRVFNPDVPRYEVIRAFKDGYSTSFKEPNMKTVGFRVADDEAPDQAAYASFIQDLERRMYDKDMVKDEVQNGGDVENPPQKVDDPDEIVYPDTKLARAYLEKLNKEKKKYEDSTQFEDSFAEIIMWFVLHSNAMLDASSRHPLFLDTDVVIRQINAAPPKSTKPSLFGFDTWDEVMQLMDFGDKGYISRSDQGRFWERYGIRSAYMKNRNPKKITSLGGLAGELLVSIMEVAEEGLLRIPDNAKRICFLNAKYIGILDLGAEQADKEFLYSQGKRGTLKWMKERFADPHPDNEKGTPGQGEGLVAGVLGAVQGMVGVDLV